MSLSPKAGTELNVSLSLSGPTQCSVLTGCAPEPCPVIGREGWEKDEQATSGYGPGGAEGWLEPSSQRNNPAPVRLGTISWEPLELKGKLR